MNNHVAVNPLWEKYKRTTWDCGGGLIWLEDFVSGEWDRTESNDEELNETYTNAANDHYETIQYWIQQFLPYKDKESEIPPEWAIEFDDDLELIDGFHRLTAATILDLATLPCQDN